MRGFPPHSLGWAIWKLRVAWWRFVRTFLRAYGLGWFWDKLKETKR